MNLLLCLINLITLAASRPSPDVQSSDAIEGVQHSLAKANCEPGRVYCFGQLTQDLGVDQQNLLHQYCNQQFKYDAQSCHGCKRPFPVPNCFASPGAWNSVFVCKGSERYDFAYRCDKWCEDGKCV
ncbi:hypothetical protein BKA66DRAFT_549193 [Pyrenochaeta sp. MPI-SDFR-AT-0127]|nr:hypothetical protein BKA66DRAFT_549193 [Pyrenochaeta sp. MPI-SDFR-AT-0127]